MKIELMEDVNPFEQEFPDVGERDEKIKKAIDTVINEIAAKTEVITLDFDSMDEDTIYFSATTGINGTAESGDYAGDYEYGHVPVSSLEDTDFEYDETDFEQHIAEALEIANNKLAAEGIRIKFSDPEVNWTDYEIEDVEDYELESGDDGIGSYEYWGSVGYDSRPYTIAVNITWIGTADIDISIRYENAGENIEEGAVGDLMKDIGHGIKQGFKSFKQARADRKDDAINAELEDLLCKALENAKFRDKKDVIEGACKLLMKGKSFDDLVEYIQGYITDYAIHARDNGEYERGAWDQRVSVINNLIKYKKPIMRRCN